MTLAIDTNIFIYAQYELYPQHQLAHAFLKKIIASASPFYISWQVYYEYIRITTHPKIHKIPLTFHQAAKEMGAYVDYSSCQLLQETPDHHRILMKIMDRLPGSSGNFIHDCHYAALLLENGISKIATADTDFMKFDFLQVINPTI